MPTFKKYKPFMACEDYVQRCTSHSTSSSSLFSTIPFVTVDGSEVDGVNNNTGNLQVNQRYLIAESVKASADDYSVNDYGGTSTGTCSFVVNPATGGIAYQIQFTANESASIKCFKFYRTLSVHANSSWQNKNCLMFAIYFDEPISVTSGNILNMSINFAYDGQQVTII